MSQHRGTRGATHHRQGRSSGNWEATAQFPAPCQCQQSLPVASSVEQSWVWCCQMSLMEPHSCSLHPAKAGNSPGCTGAASQPCCSPSLFLSHGSPGYSGSCFCHTTDLPKAAEQPWGTARAKEGRSQLLTSCEQTPGTPTPSRAGKGAPAWAGQLHQGNYLSGVPCTSTPCHRAAAQSSHAQQETSNTPASSSKDNTSEA